MLLTLRRAPLAIEATLALVVADLAVRVLPAPRTTKLLGSPGPPVVPAADSRNAEGRRVGRAVERVARALPWHPVCLPQAIATRWLLRRRGIPCVSHLGVVDTRPFSAHAWVTVDGSTVVGGGVSTAGEVARFV